MPGTWHSLTNSPLKLISGETFFADAMLLLPDGSVLVHHAGAKLEGGTEWQRLSPDETGSYRNGAWSRIGDMHNTRLFFASGVRGDGRVFVVGGEYSNAPVDPKGEQDTALGEILDTATWQWSKMTSKLPTFDWIMGDAPCCVLADGRVLLGAIGAARSAIYDPLDGSWVEAGLARGASTKQGQAGEETWTLLADGTVLTVETYTSHDNAKTAEKYVPSLDKWVPAGKTPDQLVDTDMHEIGPALLLPDGRVFAIGGTGHTAFYTPEAGAPAKPGSWKRGPTLMDPAGKLLTVNDGPACLLPNGNVLCCAGIRDHEVIDGRNEYWSINPVFFEIDPGTGKLIQLKSQPTLPISSTWIAKMLLTPSGEVLCTAEQEQMFVYQPDGIAHDAWRPTITSAPTALVGGGAYQLSGTQLNGLSHAVGYGDDYTAATNYPLVRLESNAPGSRALHYCTTSGFGYGIATGAKVTQIEFRVPEGVVPGPYWLYVVANAIASKPWPVSVSAAATA